MRGEGHSPMNPNGIRGVNARRGRVLPASMKKKDTPLSKLSFRLASSLPKTLDSIFRNHSTKEGGFGASAPFPPSSQLSQTVEGGQGTHPRLGQGSKKGGCRYSNSNSKLAIPLLWPGSPWAGRRTESVFLGLGLSRPPVFFYSDLGPSCSHARSSNIGSRAAKTKLTRFDDEGGSCFSIPPPHQARFSL